MRLAKVLMLALCIVALALPVVHGIFFIGPTNFIATNGGITTFAQNFQATRLSYPDGLNRFTNIVWDGTLRGSLGVDADTGVNITVTALNRDQIRYTVTTLAPGPVDTYIYYYRNIQDTAKLRAPSEVTADGTAAPFTYADGVATITTTGSPVAVIVSYGVGDVGAGGTVNIMIQLLPLVALVVALEARGLDLIGDKIMVMVMLIAAVGIMVWLIQAYGF